MDREIFEDVNSSCLQQFLFCDGAYTWDHPGIIQRLKNVIGTPLDVELVKGGLLFLTPISPDKVWGAISLTPPSNTPFPSH